MPELTIDGIRVQADEGETLLAAARRAGILIPTLCHHPALPPWTSCFVCLVQVAGRERFMPACATPAAEGMEVSTGSPPVLEARKAALELLLSDHAGDCEGPCRSACPLHFDIQGLCQDLTAGRSDEAAARAVTGLVLPETLGRICPRFCERACRRGGVDQPVDIAGLHALVDGGRPARPDPPPEGSPLVAVVGAGPAGIGAARCLVGGGARVVLFAGEDRPGGKLRTKIPPERLPAAVLEREIDAALAVGVEVRSRVLLGRDLELEDLAEEYGGIVLATGHGHGGDDQGFAALARGADRATGATSMRGVFAAGDALVSMGNAAVRALASGRRAALSLLSFLQGRDVWPQPTPLRVRLDERFRTEEGEGVEAKPRTDLLAGDGPTAAVIRGEADRCLRCGCQAEEDCRLRILATRYGARPRRFKGESRGPAPVPGAPGPAYDPGKCIQCGICVRLTANNPVGLIMSGRGFAMRVTPPAGVSLEQALGEKADECLECCPTGALFQA